MIPLLLIPAHKHTHSPICLPTYLPTYLPDIPHDEDEVKARQDGGHEVDVLGGRLEVVVTAEDRVGGSQNRGTTV